MGVYIPPKRFDIATEVRVPSSKNSASKDIDLRLGVVFFLRISYNEINGTFCANNAFWKKMEVQKQFGYGMCLTTDKGSASSQRPPHKCNYQT